MKLRRIGWDHHGVAVELRERFAFDRAEAGRFLDDWQERFPESEAVLVSTCNRTELYTGTLNGALPDAVAVRAFLAKEKQCVFPDELFERVVTLDDAHAASHLFAVASSLESMVVGEPQILAQIKEAYQIAAEHGAAGTVTHSVFQRALSVAKRVSAETDLFRHRVSIPSVAVADFALELFETLSDQGTLVLGAGQMASETLRYLVDNGARKIFIANRTRSKADALAGEFHAESVDWSERSSVWEKVDLVIAACTADTPIITAEHVLACQSKRANRPLFLLDLAVPRNCDPEIAQLENVYLYSLDDLAAACERNRKSRNAQLPKAYRIVWTEANSFWHDLRGRENGEAIRQLRLRWHETKERELERLFHKCPNLDDSAQDEVRYAFERLVNKMLHAPMESLRDEPDTHPTNLLDAMKRLFGL